MQLIPDVPVLEIDFDSIVYQENLEDFYQQVHELPRLFQAPDGSLYLTRFQDCRALLMDDRFARKHSNDATPWTSGRPSETPFLRMMKHWVVFTDPPEHTHYRTGLKRGFEPSRIHALEATVQGVCQILLDNLATSAPVDIVSQLAYPLPISVICILLGAPREDIPLFKGWSDLLMAGINSGKPEYFKLGDDAVQQATPYLRDLIRERRKHPADDILSDLIASDENYSEEEIAGTCLFLIWAGHETTKQLLANSVLLLDRSPALREQLSNDPSLIPGYIEEVLRLESPVQKISRWTNGEVETAGQRIPDGRLVTALIGAANRDASVFPEPHAVKLVRKPVNHLAFGKGIHHCPGAPLARLEAKVFLEQFLSRYPSHHIQSYAWRPFSAFRSLDNLMARLT